MMLIIKLSCCACATVALDSLLLGIVRASQLARAHLQITLTACVENIRFPYNPKIFFRCKEALFINHVSLIHLIKKTTKNYSCCAGVSWGRAS